MHYYCNNCAFMYNFTFTDVNFFLDQNVHISTLFLFCTILHLLMQVLLLVLDVIDYILILTLGCVVLLLLYIPYYKQPNKPKKKKKTPLISSPLSSTC